MRQFVNLHWHGTNSYGDGLRPVEEHVKAAAALGYPGMALTDHGNVTGHIKLEKHCLAAGIKPLFGCEIYTETGDERGQLKNHLTVLAETPEGFQNLNRLVSQSWVDFRYKPTVTSEMLVKYNEGLIVMSGCLGGLLSTAMFGGKGTPEKERPDRKAAEKVAGWFADLFGDRYYLEVMPHPQLRKQRAFNEELARLGARLEIPLVATLDCHYPDPSFKDMYPVIHAIDRGGRNNTVEAQSQSWEYDLDLSPRKPDVIYGELLRTGLSYGEATEAMGSTIEIMDRCNVTIPKFQELKFPGDKPSDELIWEWCRRGWKYRGLSSLSAKEQRRYVERLKYELGLIIPKGFADYFLTISEVVRWAKNSDIAVGPARGSAAASLACYLLRITEVNPMLFPTLLFERFVDENRHDLPDIDLDFDDERRWEVRQHLVDMYGEEHVGNIATVTNYKGKNSLDDIARVYRIPQVDVDTVKEMIIERSSGDLRGNTTIEDSEAMFPKIAAIFKKHPKLRLAQRLEGGLKGFSVHAAGLVVADEPLTNGVAVYSREDAKTKTMRNVLSIDKYDAEYINALKIDALGLLTMNVIARCLAMVGMTLEELYEVPLDEEEVFEAFKRNEVVGIFQFDGRAMRSVNREVKPDNFMEIGDINALSRPGPLHSGAAAEYIQIKHGRKPAEHLHPVVDEITQWTNYQIVYQEQILQVVRKLANFSWEQAAQIRKLISKKQGEQAFNRMQQLFMDGCKQNGVKDVSAGKIWKQLVTAGAYAFNSAHSISYAMIAYWCVAGKTKVYDWDNKKYITVAKAYREGVGRIACYDPETGKTIPGKVQQVVRTTGAKNANLKFGWEMVTSSGKHLTCSERHLILTPNGYKRLEEIEVGDLVAAEKRYSAMSDRQDVREKVGAGNKKAWARATESSRQRQLRGLDKSRGTGVATWRSTWESLNAEEKAAKTLPFIEGAAKAAGRLGVGLCGQATHSAYEKALCAWLVEGEIEHEHQVPLASGGVADFLVKGVYVEMGSPTWKRRVEYYFDKYEEDDAVQVVYPDDFEDKLHWVFEEDPLRRGENIVWDTVKSIEPVRDMVMYDIAMEGEPHNFLANGIVVHNTMWLKVHYPLEFYCAALQKYDPKTKGFDILKEAVKKGIKILPPDPDRSQATWSVSGKALLAGFEQIPGIGAKTAIPMVEWRDNGDRLALAKSGAALPVGFTRWEDFTAVSGIGPVTMEKVATFVGQDDPFGIDLLANRLGKARGWLNRHADSNFMRRPTSRAEDVPYEPKLGQHVLLVAVRDRNLKDLYELHRSRTGEELDPSTVKEPQFVNWAVILGEDETGPITITVHRYRGLYEKYKDVLWELNPKKHLLLVRGMKRREYRRALYAEELWVIDPDKLKG